jgi:Eco57I restriction-modification methylase
MVSTKKMLGQFMTTNYDHILKNMVIPKDTLTIIEPFCGRGDLLKFLGDDHSYTLECYDIQPQHELAIERDTIMDPPMYSGKFVLTNPPYLARNKAQNKAPFDLYKTNDLYKCFIMSIIKDRCDGGIVIIPLNFLSSIRKGDIQLRKQFMEQYTITQINIFEEQVFDDTTYTTCAIQFKLNESDSAQLISIDIYPSNTHIDTSLTEENHFMLGGHIYNLPTNENYTISRLTRVNKDEVHTNILAKCIDDNSDNQIGLSIAEIDQLYCDNTDKLSSRTYATLVISPPISIEKQTKLVDRFNAYLQSERQKYNSLFLCNYRESKDIARKRISFGLVYSICAYLLLTIDDD